MFNANFFPYVTQLIEKGHTAKIPLKGYSMRPFLENERDYALLAKPVSPNVGDPVLAEIRPGVYVLHRIVGIKDDTVILRGDGNLNTEQCRRSDIRALAVGFYRKGRSTLDKTNGLKWRIYSMAWGALLPIRRYLLGIDRRLLKLKKLIKSE